jgi:hypothetical protein
MKSPVLWCIVQVLVLLQVDLQMEGPVYYRPCNLYHFSVLQAVQSVSFQCITGCAICIISVYMLCNLYHFRTHSWQLHTFSFMLGMIVRCQQRTNDPNWHHRTAWSWELLLLQDQSALAVPCWVQPGAQQMTYCYGDALCGTWECLRWIA